jgi:dTDP-4-amino-4,6-dideoxygalactose transaminase
MQQVQFSCPNIFLSDPDFLEIRAIIDSGWVSIGRYTRKLEDIFEERFEAKHAIACSNATAGLIIAVKAAGWKGKRVAVPAFTWPSTAFALECNENKPIFCDINRDTWLIEPSDDCDAILAVDVFGNQCSISANVPVIYDAAHGFDLPDLGKRDALAEVVSFSFTKVVTGMEGGMILTNDDHLANVSRELRRLSARMGEINALVAQKSITYYDKHYNAQKAKIIERYEEGFTFPYTKQVVPIATNYSVFAICFEDQRTRNAVATELSINDIETKIYYEPLVEGLTNTDYLYSHVLSLPIHNKIEKHQQEIIDVVNETVLSCRAPGTYYMKGIGFLK